MKFMFVGHSAFVDQFEIVYQQRTLRNGGLVSDCLFSPLVLSLSPLSMGLLPTSWSPSVPIDHPVYPLATQCTHWFYVIYFC